MFVLQIRRIVARQAVTVGKFPRTLELKIVRVSIHVLDARPRDKRFRRHATNRHTKLDPWSQRPQDDFVRKCGRCGPRGRVSEFGRLQRSVGCLGSDIVRGRCDHRGRVTPEDEAGITTPASGADMARKKSAD